MATIAWRGGFSVALGYVALLLGSVFGLGLVGCSDAIDDSKIRRTTVAEVQTLLERNSERVLLVDTRPPEAVAAGTIPGAVPLRPGEVETRRRDPWLERFAVLVVFGENPGSTSARAVAKRLMIARYRDVRMMEAGIDGWRARGLPTGEAGARGRGPAR